MNALHNSARVAQTLDRLHSEASSQGLVLAKGLAKGIFRKLRPEDMKDAYIAISRDQGLFLHDLIQERGSKSIVEFGTSLGISTIYLAEAAQQNNGHVITTELLPEKCAVAQANFEEAGLAEVIELREGDALKTLANLEEEIDLLMLDGWNDLYRPLLHLLEPNLRKGSLIYMDNANFSSSADILNYFEAIESRYKRISDPRMDSRAALFEVIR